VQHLADFGYVVEFDKSIEEQYGIPTNRVLVDDIRELKLLKGQSDEQAG